MGSSGSVPRLKGRAGVRFVGGQAGGDRPVFRFLFSADL